MSDDATIEQRLADLEVVVADLLADRPRRVTSGAASTEAAARVTARVEASRS